jgi:general secretion pathway protein B
MSLILDALRKSEAERRRGQAPDLFAPVAASANVPTKAPVAVILIALAAILVAATIAFWPTAPAGHSEPSIAPAVQTSDARNAPATVATPILDMPISQPKPPPRAVQPTGAVIKPIITPPIAAAAPTKSQPENAAPDSSASNNSIDDTQPAPVGVDGGSAPTTDNADTSDSEPALPTLATLDSASRAALPPLQLSMHVWNPDAAARFAIIDGQRLGEGGKVGNVVVAQIRRDGVVLDIDGRQFLLPRP